MFESAYQSEAQDSEIEASDNDAESDDRSPEQTMDCISGLSPRFSAANMSKCRAESVFGMLLAREEGTPHCVSGKTA